MERTTELSNRQLGLWNIWEKKAGGGCRGDIWSMIRSLMYVTRKYDSYTGLEVCSACIFNIIMAAISVMTYVRSISGNR